MPIVNTTTVSNKTATESASGLQALSSAASIIIPLSEKTTTAVATAVTGISKTSLTSVLSGSTTSLQSGTVIDVIGSQGASLLNVGNNPVTSSLSSIPKLSSSSLTATIAGASTYLTKAISSITDVFSGGVKSLAAGLDPKLATIFSNTLVKSNSTITTAISDPVFTNLTATTNPISSIFKVNSATGLSSASTTPGAISTSGSNSQTMIGTNLSTVLDRLNLDQSVQLSVLTNSLKDSGTKESLSTLFSNPSSLVATVTAIKALPEVATTSRAVANDLNVLVSRANSIVSNIGDNALAYAIKATDSTLINQIGEIVSVKPTADSTTANALLNLATTLGCVLSDGTEYSSSMVNSSLYNMLLQLSSKLGLTDLLSSLTSCSTAATSGGQSALSAAYAASVGDDVSSAGLMLSVIDNPFSLNTEALRQATILNASLTSADVSAVSSLLTTTGSSIDKAYSVPDLSQGDVIVFNSSILNRASPSFTNGYFQDKALSTYASGSAVSWDISDLIAA